MPGGLEPSAVEHFIDRESESSALAAAFAHHRARCSTDEIDGQSFLNIITFYGIGGIGKSALSKRLENWIDGRLPADGSWGIHPAVSNLVTIRWELGNSQGNLDVVPLLMSVRSELHRYKRSWPAFDVAFAAYFSSLRPGETLPVTGLKNSDYADGFLQSLSEIALDLGTSELITGLTATAVRRLVRLAGEKQKDWRATRTNPQILDLLDRCLTEPSPGNQVPELAAEILWQLSLELADLPPAGRPTIVIFVDHFERLQGAARGGGEYIVNRFVGNLPHAFFVVTGRNMLDWYRPDRIDLKLFGEHRWPGLTPGTMDGARQHLLGHLSPEDTRRLLVRRRDIEHLNISDSVLEALVATTNGWPVHIDAVGTHARRLREIDPSRELTINDLGGTLETVIDNLLRDLPADERRAFQAACLMPSFDAELIEAIVPTIDIGAIARCINRALVVENLGTGYRYKVHDEIRAAVRASQSTSSGTWAPGDWTRAADRAGVHARHRFENAKDDDSGQIKALALGIGLGLQQDIEIDWITEALRTGPALGGVGPHIPPSDRFRTDARMRPIVELIEALHGPTTDATEVELKRLSLGGSSIEIQAGLWRAYRLRSDLSRHQDALRQLEELLDRDPRRENLYRRQIAVTHYLFRHFQDAKVALEGTTAVSTTNTLDLMDRSVGIIAPGLGRFAERVANETFSRRYQLELTADLALARTRLGQMEEAPLIELLGKARDIGHRSMERDTLLAIGYLNLCKRDRLLEIVARLTAIAAVGSKSPAALQLLALRAMTGYRDEELQAAVESARALPFRSSSWIATEIFAEELGHRLPELATQWPEPQETIRVRWLSHAERIIDKARDLA
jgi:hypothetical protein